MCLTNVISQTALTTKREVAATEEFIFELYTIVCRFFVNIEKIDKTDLYTLLCRCFVIIGKIDKTDPYSLFAVNACKSSAENNLQNYNFKNYWNVEQEVSCTKVNCKREVSGVCIVLQM